MPKKALVTGSLGFIGRRMVGELVSRGYLVDGVDPEYPIGPIANEPGPGGEQIIGYYAESVFEDLCELDCHNNPYDLVVHCAYHVGGRAAIDGINTNFAKNLHLDASMFEWAVRTKQRRVLYFSSSAVYPKWLQAQCESCDDPNCQEGPVDQLNEDRADISLTGWQPSDPDANYGFAKLAGERLAEDARRNGLSVTVVRPFSGYGEYQSLDYPFPSIIKRAREGDLTVWGPPGQCRDWIHVDDVVRGSLAVVDSGTVDPINLCTGVATEMGELALRIRAMSGYPGHEGRVEYLEDKPTGVFYRIGDPTRMLQYYTPTASIEEGIRRALDA